jgi:hypothetical protein
MLAVGQIQVDEAGAWLRWRPRAEPTRLPEEVWEAIREFLATSGRLPNLTDACKDFAQESSIIQVRENLC